MKIKHTSGLLVLGLTLAALLPAQAQTTPTSNPAAKSNSMSASGTSRQQKRAMKKNRRNRQSDNAETGNTSTQNARYRESSVSDGTAINNSNVTNYNSNNVTNAPTGAGSNPNTKQVLKTVTDPGTKPATEKTDGNVGSAEAVSGAKSTEEPAIRSGSTVRNTSIGDFMASSPNFTTLQNALQSADLSETLKGTGPFTIFAPTNSAFKKLPAAVQGQLLDGNNKDALKQLLTYHVVSGNLSASDMARQLKDGNGSAKLTTLAGGTLTAQSGANGSVMLMDEQGNKVTIKASEGHRQQNGMVYEVDLGIDAQNGCGCF